MNKVKTTLKITREKCIDFLYYLAQTYIHWYLKKYIYPFERKDVS